MLAFKRVSNIPEYETLNSRLQEVLIWLEPLWPGPMVITRLRTPSVEGESGVHPDGRGADLRTRDLPDWLPLVITDMINRAWDHGSDGRYEVAYLESDHIHLQVRDTTHRRQGGS